MVSGTTFTGNTADFQATYGYGAGMLVSGSSSAVTVTGSTFEDNHAVRGGGAISGSPFDDGVDTLVVTDSTISGNTGGGLHIDAASATITSSTISGNTGGLRAGGVDLDRLGRGLDHRPLDHRGERAGSFGSEGGGLHLGAAATLDHTIVGDNSPADIDGPGGVTLTHSLVESTAAGVVVTDGGGNVQGVDPGLLPLEDNGGPTLTHALAPASAALDAGDPGFAPPPAVDQRGELRVSGPVIDIGAFELEQTPVVTPGGGGVTEGNAGHAGGERESAVVVAVVGAGDGGLGDPRLG